MFDFKKGGNNEGTERKEKCERLCLRQSSPLWRCDGFCLEQILTSNPSNKLDDIKKGKVGR